MPTMAQRINITVPTELSPILNARAKRRNVSLSKTVIDLISDAIDRDEDEALLRIAERSEASTDRLYSMDEAWGRK